MLFWKSWICLSHYESGNWGKQNISIIEVQLKTDSATKQKNETFDLLKNNTFDLMKFDLMIISRGYNNGLFGKNILAKKYVLIIFLSLDFY